MKCLAGLTVMIVACSAFAGSSTPTVLYSTLDGSATSVLPGVPNGVELESLNRFEVSPGGVKWIMSGTIEVGQRRDEVLFVGDIVSRTATMVYQEEVTLVEGFETTQFESLAINDIGKYILEATLTDFDEKVIIKWDGSSYSIEAREGEALPHPIVGESFNDRLYALSVWNDGTIAFGAGGTIGSLDNMSDDFVIVGGEVFLQTGVSVPGDQPDSQTGPWTLFSVFDFSQFESRSLSSYVMSGRLEGSVSGIAIAIDGDVVIAENNTIPASADPRIIRSLHTLHRDDANNWMVGGLWTEPFPYPDFVLRNGVIVAETGDPVPGLTGVSYDSLSVTAMNNNGHYVLFSFTDEPSGQDRAYVLDNTTLLLHQGDPIDIDGNGMFDDDAYLERALSAALLDNGEFWFSAIIRDGNSVEKCRALMFMQAIDEPACPSDLTDSSAGPPDGEVNVFDLFVLLSNWNTAGPGAELALPHTVVDVFDLFVLLSGWGPCQ